MDTKALIDTDNIEIEISICLGRTRQTVGKLSNLGPDDVLTLDQGIGDGVEICVGDRVIAHGEIVANTSADARLSVRISNTVDQN